MLVTQKLHGNTVQGQGWWWSPSLYLTAVLLLTAVLRLPSFFEPHWYNDEGIFAAVAHGLLRGDRLYAEVWDHKPPLIYALYALVVALAGNSIPALRLLTTFSVLATQLLVFQIGRRLLGPVRAGTAALLYGLLATVPSLEGTLALTEVFMVLPTTAAIAVYVRAWAARPAAASLSTDHWLTIGLLFGIASGFKPVAIFDAAALGFFLLLYERQRLRALAPLVLGLAAPWFFFLALFAAWNALPAFLDANIGYQYDYMRMAGWRLDLRLLVTLGPLVAAVGYAVLNRDRPTPSLIVLWLGFAMAGATMGGFAYAHYMIQGYPALVLGLGNLVPGRPQLRVVLPVACLALLIAFALYRYTGVLAPLSDPHRIGRYYRDLAAALLEGDADRFYDTFGAGWWRTRDLTRALRQAGAQGQPVLLWGNHAWVYPLADIRPVGRFVMASHVSGDPDREGEVSAAVQRVAPAYIVLEEGVQTFPALDILVLQRYRCESGAPSFLICRLTSHVQGPSFSNP